MEGVIQTRMRQLQKCWILFGLVLQFNILFRDQCLSVQAAIPSTDGVCDGDSSTGECLLGRPFAPSDLPLPRLFDAFDSNTSLSVSDRELTVLHGSILQQGHSISDTDTADTNQNNATDADSELVVLPGVIPREVVAEVLTLLRGHENADKAGGRTTIALDEDPDSVDGMTSQEIFLDNDSIRQGGFSKSVPENVEERKELREKVRKFLDPYLYDVITPFLREWYGEEKCGRDGRKCTSCYSLIRRYRAGERQSHAPHHDRHSFISVVVSLTDYGDEYKGGLYVSTKSSERHYVKLNRGDAVAHQSSLHHGVRVLDQRDDGGPSERWSWIMWFRDSDTCEDHGREWHLSCAEEGNPTCMYLRATTESSQEDVLMWNQKASDAGHAQASVKLAYAYLKKLPSHLEYDRNKAMELFESAIAVSNEPDGHYGLATLYLEGARARIMSQPDNQSKQKAAVSAMGGPYVTKAISHLVEAAKGGHVFAMFNLGICHTFGYGTKSGEKDYELAAEWFEASGLPEGLQAKAMYLGSVGRTNEAREFNKKAQIMGFGKPWRKMARERTGSGGSGGVSMNLMWPPLPGGVMPPTW